jgi:hypothetical protein
MENSIDNLTENACFAESGNQQSDFFSGYFNAASPGDEDEENSESEDAGNESENPPLDPSIVHSPVPTQTGGRPPGA